MMKITVPIATRGGNRLLMLRDFLTDQVPLPSEPAEGWGPGGDRHTARCVRVLSSSQGQAWPGLLWKRRKKGHL